MTETDIFAHLEFMNWRDAQLADISTQLETEFPDLLRRIDQKIDEAGTLDLAWSEVQLGTGINQVVSEWAEDQTVMAMTRTKAALSDFQYRLETEMSLDPGMQSRLVAMAPALASAGLAAASIAAVPTVLSFATVSTSVLAVFGVSTISWPLFSIGAVALGVTALASRSLFDWAVQNWRDSLRDRAHQKAQERIFGLGLDGSQRTVLDDIQALVIQTAAQNLEPNS
ncbi:hypothetical protein [Arenibacterium sp. LLYu02]|uniref:hypothetical protein n=1 Tax=Arenibacterium sp. LLYu02 TaxID=3404132 RepID=UPI003B2172F1